MAELADAPDLGSGIARCEGSTPFARTKICPGGEMVDTPDSKSGLNRVGVRVPPGAPHFGHVAQLAEVADLKSVKCGFESHRGYHDKPVD